MAQLIVRSLEPELVQELKRRAAAHGRSAEEEHREILRAALARPSMKAVLLDMPEVGDDSDFGRPTHTDRDISL